MPPKPPITADTLKRERAGTYRTHDGRFTVEQSSSGWLIYDAEQTDELGLPLARGPFPTLDGAKAAFAEARRGPAPSSKVPSGGGKALERPGKATPAAKLTATRTRPTLVPAPDAADPEEAPGPPALRTAKRPARPSKPAKPPVVIRDIRAVDCEALRAMWKAAGFALLGDDDLGLARLVRRNPGLVLVASEGTRVIGSALGAWDGRRGWIYHVAVAPSHRRQGIATRLVDQVEEGLRALGCRKVNVLVRPDSDGGRAFWAARGYEAGASTQFGTELGSE